MKLIAKNKVITFPRPTLIMGIINITPDSFYAESRCENTKTAIERAAQMIAAGAEILDVGGESTRPGADPVPEEEEMARVLPAIKEIAVRWPEVLISIDTMKPQVAEAALKAGAHIVNDVAANRSDPTMWEIVARYKAGYICMHMLGCPQTMQLNPQYDDVVNTIAEFFAERLHRLGQAGVDSEQVVLDPGIGFGKTVDHNLELLRRLNRFAQFGRPILVGVSRKSFIGKLFNLEVKDRLPGSLACACWCVLQGAAILRVHDVHETVQTVRMFELLLKTQ